MLRISIVENRTLRRFVTQDSLIPSPVPELNMHWIEASTGQLGETVISNPENATKIGKRREQLVAEWIEQDSRRIEGMLTRHVLQGEGMNSALQFHSTQFESIEGNPYATADDFQRLFAREMTDLLRLSLNLTADAEKAESCLILAMRQCFASGTVSKEWAHIWARRMVVRNAIRSVLGEENTLQGNISCETGADFHLQPTEYRIEALQGSLAILDLPDFDRLVFVICVLERHSILDCALLLRRSPKDVHDARVRATNQVVSIEEQNHRDGTTSRTNSYGACSDGGGELDGSCGSILD